MKWSMFQDGSVLKDYQELAPVSLGTPNTTDDCTEYSATFIPWLDMAGTDKPASRIS